MTWLQELATSVAIACCHMLQTLAGHAKFTASFRAQLTWRECQKHLIQQLVWQDCQRLLIQDVVYGTQECRQLAGLVR